jgi:hypothetical protein
MHEKFKIGTFEVNATRVITDGNQQIAIHNGSYDVFVYLSFNEFKSKSLGEFIFIPIKGLTSDHTSEVKSIIKIPSCCINDFVEASLIKLDSNIESFEYQSVNKTYIFYRLKDKK